MRLIREEALAGALTALILLAACGGEDTGLSRADVDEMGRAEVAQGQTEQPSQPPPSHEEANRTDQVAADARPEPAAKPPASTGPETADPGYEGTSRASPVGIPPKSDSAAYTRFLVDAAIGRYETEGLAATLAHYNNPASLDGQWYVFIIDEEDLVIAHPDPGRLGLDLKGWAGSDANGYNYGAEMRSATAEGKWVSYVYRNPAKAEVTPGDLSDVELKNAWVIRHDGLLFASGWYIDVDQFTVNIVAALVELFRTQGIDGTMETLNSDPASLLGGAAESAAAYNASGAVQGEWSPFIADPEGTIVLHLNPARIGTKLEDALGPEPLAASGAGAWLTSDSMRIWAVEEEGWTFGAGWRSDAGSDGN